MQINKTQKYLSPLDQLKLIEKFLKTYQDLQEDLDSDDYLFEDSLEHKIRKLVQKNKGTMLEDVKVVETADVPIIKMRFMAIMVDISIGQLAGFCTLHFMNYAD